MKTRYNLIMSTAIAFLVLPALLLFSGCSDFFSVKEAETPAGNQTLASAMTPQELLDLFKNSLQNSNSALYLSLLADSILTGREYAFISEAQDVTADDFHGWNKSNEKQFIERLFKESYISQLSLTTEPFAEPQQDTISVKFSYQFEVINQNKTAVRGNSSFTLVKKNSSWYLACWKDEYYQLNGFISFSKLKFEY